MAIIEGLQNWTMKTPGLFGIFHIASLYIVAIVTALLVCLYRNADIKIMKRIVFISWILLVVFEVFKQLIVSHEGGEWKYNWYHFPYQFCETPLYVLPILLLVRNEKARNALIAFISTYVFFAGFALMVLPLTLYSEKVFFNIRTMLEHGIQVMLGIYLFAWNRKNMNAISFLQGSIIFIGTVIVAVILNSTIGIKHPEINMFFLSKNNDSIILILKEIKPHVPWVIYLLSYLVGFTLCSIISYTLFNFIYKITSKIEPISNQEVEYKN